MRSVLRIGLVLSLAFAFFSCAQPPEEELKAAADALAAAKMAEADIYAPETYQSAQDTLNEANVQGDPESDQRDYESSRISAIRAKELADRATQEAGVNKEQTRNEAQDLITRLSTELTDFRAALNNVPRGKGADDDLDQLQSDLAQSEASLSDAKNSLNTGNFKDALDQARSAEDNMSQVQGAVQTAMQKVEAWRIENRPWYEL